MSGTLHKIDTINIYENANENAYVHARAQTRRR